MEYLDSSRVQFCICASVYECHCISAVFSSFCDDDALSLVVCCSDCLQRQTKSWHIRFVVLFFTLANAALFTSA